MKIEQIYTGCLAQGAYYVESEGEAVVIDPLREVESYLEKAEKDGAQIKYVFETHFHADFVSGHIDLAQKTGATIVYGPTAKPGFEAYTAKDDEEFKVGKITFRVLHTPGHTMESVCFLLIDENGREQALFSGDTLFIGDVGRPDLAQKAANMTQEQLAETLYDSLRNKVMTLPDEVVVYPAHGAGSACGKNLSKETQDSLGNQKMTNYALRADMTKAEFVHEVTNGLMPPPAYFPMNVTMNKLGYESIDSVLERGTQALSPRAFEVAANETGALILDTRDADKFARGFIPNSINIGLDGNFAPWVGALIPDVKQAILIVADQNREEEVVTRLARVGYDNCLGFLQGGMEAWEHAGLEFDELERISAEQLAEIMHDDPEVPIFDVRKQSEYLSQHVAGVENAPLDSINESMQMIPKDRVVVVHCAGGYRSMMFVSILRARGYDNIIDVKGGFSSILQTGKFKVTDYVCPTTML
jgi:glyoxylase-like metal-dependent hydrolase (beta-lactamase superfamily II)/rhodanese-related sulfurtransferase